VSDRLNQIERDGLASILRIALADANPGQELLVLMDLQQPTSSPNPNTQEGTAP
jgi:hypothetical protein